MNVLDDSIGPLLTDAEVVALLGGDEEIHLAEVVALDAVIRLEDDLGEVRYPMWQFDLDLRRPYPVIGELLELCRDSDEDEWYLASYCASPSLDLEGRRPKDALDDDDTARLLTALRRDLALGR